MAGGLSLEAVNVLNPETASAPRRGAVGLGEIALHEPVLAATLLGAGRVGETGYIDLRSGWEIVNLVARWTSTGADQQIEAKTLEQICNDLWVRDVVYTVRRPLFQAGSPWKGLWDYYNARNPNIDFTLIIKSYCDYAISPDPTPLENIVTRFDCVCPAGLVLKYGATFDSFFTNLRALSADENPTEAIVTFQALRLPNRLYGSISYDKAVQELQARGYLPA